MKINFRRWRLEDRIPVQQVVWNTWLATYGSFIPEADLKWYFQRYYSLHALEDQYKNPSIVTLVAEVDGTVVGFERTNYSSEENRYYVASLYVLPTHHGFGIGKKLMQMAAEEARGRGLDKVWLGVMVQNTQAVEWYRKLGFVTVEEAPFAMGDTTVNHYIGYVPVDALIASAKKVPASK